MPYETQRFPINMIVEGTLDVAGAITASTGLNRSQLIQTAAAAFTIPFTSFRVHDAMATLLPAAAADDDLGLNTGTPGTNSLTLRGVDFGGTTTDEKGAFDFTVPVEYDAAETITVRVRCGILTTVADTSLTIDCECWKADGDGAVGSDLCSTAAQSCNSLTLANKDFTITPTGIAAGDTLIFRLSFAGTDAGNLGVMVPVISKVSVLLDIKG